jgi:hypothetical protein
MAVGKSGWDACRVMARAILRDRAARRRITGRILLAALLALAAGLWLVDGWLASDPRWFLAWWGGCALLACTAVLFALYDALAVIREERGGRH